MTDKLAHVLSAALLTAALLLTAACSTTRLTSVWQDEELQGHGYGNILVIGVAEQEHNRRLFEQHFVDELEAIGIKAEASYRILRSGTEITRDTIAPALKGRGIDAVVITHLVGVEKETVYRPPIDYASTRGYYNGLYNYYPAVHGYVTTPGYYTTHEIVKLETNLYDAGTEKLVWSAQSETFAPESAEEVIDDLIRLVITDLKAGRILK